MGCIKIVRPLASGLEGSRDRCLSTFCPNQQLTFCPTGQPHSPFCFCFSFFLSFFPSSFFFLFPFPFSAAAGQQGQPTPAATNAGADFQCVLVTLMCYLQQETVKDCDTVRHDQIRLPTYMDSFNGQERQAQPQPQVYSHAQAQVQPQPQ